MLLTSVQFNLSFKKKPYSSYELTVIVLVCGRLGQAEVWSVHISTMLITLCVQTLKHI